MRDDAGMYTKHPPVKQVPAVYLALKERGRDVTEGIPREDSKKNEELTLKKFSLIMYLD